MEPFDTLRAVAAPYPQANVDTDRIIRVERCVRTPREEMGRWAFEMERYDADGRDVPGFFANRPAFSGARILVAGENFGCGSSREMAVWAIAGLGIRCVIAPSFGEIFRGNCFQNGLLPVRLPASAVATMLVRLEAAADAPVQARTLTVDLRALRVDTPWGEAHAFEVEPLRREGLLEGLDAIGLTLRRGEAIDRFQAWQRQARPWVYRS